jgi:hypothetical protein
MGKQLEDDQECIFGFGGDEFELESPPTLFWRTANWPFDLATNLNELAPRWKVWSTPKNYSDACTHICD